MDDYIYIYIYVFETKINPNIVQSDRAVEYTGCISTEEQDPPNEFPGYDTKQSDGEVPVMLELWQMPSTPSLPSLIDPLWPGGVAPDMGQIELNCVLMLK